MSENYKFYQSGNALWFILIAVALLGVLTMVLSRGGSSVDQTGDFERQRIASGQILRYAKSIEAAIQDMRLRDVSENDISFANSTTTTDYTNAACDDTADASFPDCLLFDADGAGLAYRNFVSVNDGSDWIFTAANNIGSTAGPIGSTAAGSGNDLVMLLPNMSAPLCIQINRDLDIGTAGTTPTDGDVATTTAFTGAYPGGGPLVLDGDSQELDNHQAGCFTDGASVTYFYYTVLAR